MHVPELSHALAERGHRIVVAGYPGSPLMKEAVRRGLQTWAFAIQTYLHPLQQWKLHHFLKNNGIQIIHSHYSRDLWTIVPALRKLPQIPLFLTKHIGTQRPKTDYFHQKIYARVDKILAISQVIYANILQTHPVQKNQVELFNLGIDTKRFKPVASVREKMRQEFLIPPNAIAIGIAGRLQQAKGYVEFLEMAASVSKRHPETYFLLIGGASRGEDAEAQIIRKKAEELNLGARLIFTGFRSDIENVLQALDIFVFPSHAEAYGLVILEAMAVGLPVISSNCDGILDIVVEGETGELVPPRDVAQLSDRTEVLIQSPKKRKQYGLAGRKRVQTLFNFCTMVDNLETLYERGLLQRRR